MVVEPESCVVETVDPGKTLKFNENPEEVVVTGATTAVVVAAVELGNENPVAALVANPVPNAKKKKF